MVFLITGASSGIGLALAKTLIEKGNIVYCAARRLERMANLKIIGGHIISLDLNDDKSIVNCVNKIISEQGGIDVLVNNAGYGLYGPVECTPMDEGRQEMEVNFFAIARLCQLILPYMREKKDGRIINISSIAGRIYSPMSAWYVASKYALEGFTDCLRLEASTFNIKVILIEPSPIKTNWSDGAKQTLETYSMKTPYQDFGMKSLTLLKSVLDGNMISEPQEAVNVIIKAIYAESPKTRYLCGKLAKISIIARSFMCDKLFDYVIKKQMNK